MTFPFLKLPKKLREFVRKQLIPVDSLKFLQTCKSLRLTILVYGPIPEKIQDLSIRFPYPDDDGSIYAQADWKQRIGVCFEINPNGIKVFVTEDTFRDSLTKRRLAPHPTSRPWLLVNLVKSARNLSFCHITGQLNANQRDLLSKASTFLAPFRHFQRVEFDGRKSELEILMKEFDKKTIFEVDMGQHWYLLKDHPSNEITILNIREPVKEWNFELQAQYYIFRDYSDYAAFDEVTTWLLTSTCMEHLKGTFVFHYSTDYPKEVERQFLESSPEEDNSEIQVVYLRQTFRLQALSANNEFNKRS
ncbi:unnamed protein product, partial [Mesorhabditis belari]|uniref:F-box domain-containing protein n=1 Tax=Mesorhabditis belari TaxID=2138241 RepID=A0AAF3FRB8_9BILA